MLKTFKQLSLDDIQIIKTIEASTIKDLQDYCESITEDTYLTMCPGEVVDLASISPLSIKSLKEVLKSYYGAP